MAIDRETVEILGEHLRKMEEAFSPIEDKMSNSVGRQAVWTALLPLAIELGEALRAYDEWVEEGLQEERAAFSAARLRNNPLLMFPGGKAQLGEDV